MGKGSKHELKKQSDTRTSPLKILPGQVKVEALLKRCQDKAIRILRHIPRQGGSDKDDLLHVGNRETGAQKTMSASIGWLLWWTTRNASVDVYGMLHFAAAHSLASTRLFVEPHYSHRVERSEM